MSIDINLDEACKSQVYDSTNGLIVGSNLGNYYRQTQIETLVIDHSALEVGEYLIAYNYQYGNYYSNLGNIYYLDNQNGEFYASMAFAPHDGVNDYIDYVIVLYDVYLLSEAGMYVKQGEVIEEALFIVGIDLIIETPVFGSTYELLVPEPRDGQEFLGWFTDLDWMIEVSSAPSSSQAIYGAWANIIE